MRQRPCPEAAMFNSAVLEVAIGIAFVFLLVSLMVSSLTELIASWGRWRGANLWKGLRAMLGNDVQEQLYAHPLIRTLITPHTKPPYGLQRLLALPGLRRLWPGAKGPSYIPARTFAYALLDLIERPYQTLESLNAAIDVALADSTRAAEIVKTLANLSAAEPFKSLIQPRV